jgi:hypothetical protein
MDMNELITVTRREYAEMFLLGLLTGLGIVSLIFCSVFSFSRRPK